MALVRAARYIALLILAGLLSPEEFGLFAALYVIVDGLVLLQGFGIGHALIYRQEKSEEAADTSFLLSVSIGILLLALAWFLAPTVERFYAANGMTAPFRACSIVLIIHALRLLPFRLVEKALDFKNKLVPAIAGSLAYLIVALSVAYQGGGVWALVAAEIASLSSETLAYWLMSPWKPKLRFELSLARQDLRFGWIVLGGTLLVFLFMNLDRVVISRAAGTYALGLYALAYAIANLPATLFVRALNTVLLPSYSSLGENREPQKILFLRATSYTAAIGGLYVIGLLAFGRYALKAAYGDTWLECVAALHILAFFALFRALSALVGDLLVGIGSVNTFRKICALQLAVACAGLYFGVTRGGISGVALAMAAASACSLVAGWRQAHKILDASPGDFMGSLLGPLGACTVAVVSSLCLRGILPAQESLLAVLAAAIAVALCFGLGWFAFDRELRADSTQWWKSLQRNRATSSDARRSPKQVLYCYYQGLAEPIPRLHGLAQIRALAGDRIRSFAVLSFENQDRKPRAKTNDLYRKTRRWLLEAGVKHAGLPRLNSRWLDIPLGVSYMLFAVLFRGVRILHCRSYIPTIMGLLVRILTPTRLLFDMRGLFVDEYLLEGALREGSSKLAFARWLERQLLLRSDAIVVVSEKFRTHLLSMPDLRANIVPARIHVIPNRVEQTRFSHLQAERSQLREKLGWQNRVVGVFVGSSASWHRLDQIMEAAARVMKKRDDVCLLVITYPSAEKARATATAAGIPEDRMAALSATVDEVPGLLAASDFSFMFVQKHISKDVCAPIKFSEYMAAGLPVVAGGSLGDVGDWIAREKLGVVVDPDDAEATLGRIQDLLSSEEFRTGGIRERCRVFAARQLDMKTTLEEYDAIYRSLDAQ
jgi:O-antigen/teichoic acid export membrane protein/glycosyltransferase involved in cell wall biosynthesis